jgi:putative transposase
MGGVLRSQGGWAAVKALRGSGAYQKGDERILGDSHFAEEVLSQVDEELQQKYRMQAQGYDLQKLLQRVAKIMDMSSEAIMDPGKNRKGVQARSILCYWATDQLRISQTQLAHMLNLTQPAVSEAVKRGKQLAKMHGYSLIEENKL